MNLLSLQVELVSSARRVRKRNLDDFEGSSTKIVRSKKPKSRQKQHSKRKSSRANVMRPQRVAARNALTMFSQYSGTSTGGEDEDDSEDSSSERDPVPVKFKIERNETERKLHVLQQEECGNENQRISLHSGVPESQSNAGERKRLVLKLPLRDSKKPASSEDVKTATEAVNPTSKPPLDSTQNRICIISKGVASCSRDPADMQLFFHENRDDYISEGLGKKACTPLKECTVASENEDMIRSGEVKVESSAHLEFDVFPMEALDWSKPMSTSYMENENSLKRYTSLD